MSVFSLAIRSVLVVGGGSAGFLAALILKKRCPELEVTVVRSKEIGVIGVGESTTVAMPRFLHGGLELDPGEFYREVQPSWKLGIHFLWGPRPSFEYAFDVQLDWKIDQLSHRNGFYCEDDFTYASTSAALMQQNKIFLRRPDGAPLIDRTFGYHLENRRFVAYLERCAVQRGITILEGTVTGATQDDNGITAVQLQSGQALTADLYVDCSGFRSLLLGKALQEPFISFKSSLFCDRAVVSAWPRTDEPILPYTIAETMESGWCWRIDHPDYVNRGYVYSSSFISDEEAEREFRAKNPSIDNTWIVKFVSGRYERTWVKNVVAVGNSSGFVEPLESTALAIICDESRFLAETLYECNHQPTPLMVKYYNLVNARAWDTIRDFLAIHYRFNTRVNSQFWQTCRAETELGPIQEFVDYYQERGPNISWRYSLIHPSDMFGVEGYLALLVGQKVPYRARYTATEEEIGIWKKVQANHRQLAENGIAIPEALNFIASSNCRWNPSFFQTPQHLQLTSYIGTAS
ncbi:MAG: tryptophan halogenase family protein [Gemmataceae bacterium]